MSRDSTSLLTLVIICIIAKLLVMFVAFVQQSELDARAESIMVTPVCRTEFGQRCGCILIYRGRGKYTPQGDNCPKED